jgi:hypothetical protein
VCPDTEVHPAVSMDLNVPAGNCLREYLGKLLWQIGAMS